MEKPSAEEGGRGKERESSAGGDNVRYKGVRMRKWGKWVAEVRLPNSRKRIWLGSYDTAGKAARAYDAAVFCLRGPSAQLNFPANPPEIPLAGKLTPDQIQSVAASFAHQSPVEEVASDTPEAVQVAAPGEGSSMANWVGDPMDGDPGLGFFGSCSEYGLFPAEFFIPAGDRAEAEEEEEEQNASGAFYHPHGLWNF